MRGERISAQSGGGFFSAENAFFCVFFSVLSSRFQALFIMHESEGKSERERQLTRGKEATPTHNCGQRRHF